MSNEAKIKAEAEQRVARAKEYARRFPQFSKLSDAWCNLEWQIALLTKYFKAVNER